MNIACVEWRVEKFIHRQNRLTFTMSSGGTSCCWLRRNHQSQLLLYFVSLRRRMWFCVQECLSCDCSSEKGKPVSGKRIAHKKWRRTAYLLRICVQLAFMCKSALMVMTMSTTAVRHSQCFQRIVQKNKQNEKIACQAQWANPIFSASSYEKKKQPIICFKKNHYDGHICVAITSLKMSTRSCHKHFFVFSALAAAQQHSSCIWARLCILGAGSRSEILIALSIRSTSINIIIVHHLSVSRYLFILHFCSFILLIWIHQNIIRLFLIRTRIIIVITFIGPGARTWERRRIIMEFKWI